MAIYLISDTHFDHANIIDYCDRPFSSVTEMDSKLKENWNKTISEDDKVIFGGDLAMAKSSVALEYARDLAGQMILILGNHDDIDADEATFDLYKSVQFSYEHKGQQFDFYYTHWPQVFEQADKHLSSPPEFATPPPEFDGWVLHGHVHNNDIETYPFVNPTQKYVNLSVELIDYTPIELSTLCDILQENERYEKLSDVPDRLLSK